VDASNELVGRLAAQLSKVLQGKDKPIFRPDRDCGDVIVCEHASEVSLTHSKWRDKTYAWHTGHRLKREQAADLHNRKPTAVLERAVYGMLPKNNLRKDRMRKLLLYPHAQTDFADEELVDWQMPFRKRKREDVVPIMPEGFEPLNPDEHARRLQYARKKGTVVEVNEAELFNSSA
jgi:large subunit ribosomal protein L13